MRVLIVENEAEVARAAAEQVADVIRRGRGAGRAAVLGVATGSSPLGIYHELAAQVRGDRLDTAGVSAFALDEYVGLDAGHPESYHSVIRRTVTEPLRLDPARVHVPNGTAADLEAECRAYERAIRGAGGIDLQLLGIGSNGHVGFNEPVSSFASRTRLKTLAPQTRADNARFFESPEQVPVHCVTQGLGTILEADRLLLVAHGTAKADAVARMIEGPLTSMCPASVLQLHPEATVIVDREAAAELQLTDYYEWVQHHLPEGLVGK
ncbi:glucosamine-6-phosphate deaminase [Leucobacter viscericola]|uniref:Glucosamine-6-phosphate deaminase n=1 Tax=Leucobacter viscericola TaxID=2714935 RepID=A0A6G7XH30_9MICO|nr:glucosamine-6-phosphate deaminase [Leucobacter viscericola]QIK63914.1 glucosamine-6-phosphate deaminase [Leucobacter viscericola]